MPLTSRMLVVTVDSVHDGTPQTHVPALLPANTLLSFAAADEYAAVPPLTSVASVNDPAMAGDGVGVTLGVGVIDAVGVGVMEGVGVIDGVTVGMMYCVGVAVGVLAGVGENGVGVWVGVGVTDGVGVGV